MTDHARELCNDIARILDDKKGEDIQILDIADITVIAEGFVIASASNTTQVRALAGEVEEKLKEQGEEPLRMEGYDAGRWVVLDYGDVLVHIFLKEEREFYNLERLWSDGKNALEYPQK